MKKAIQRYICIFLSLIIVSSALGITTCFAKTVNGPAVSVVMEDISNDAGKKGICANIYLNENPGIGAFTFTLSYNKDVFKTSNLRKRYFYSCTLANYEIVDHPESGYISLVWADHNGITYTGTGKIISLDFEIISNTDGKYDFKIGNIDPSRNPDILGCFADFEKNSLIPDITNGTYIIGNPNPSCSHSFSATVTVNPSCTSEGFDTRTCNICGEIEKTNVKSALGHSYNDFWTVDRIAETNSSMVVSRHCVRCDSTVDKTYYSSDKVKELGIENKVGAKVTPNAQNNLKKEENEAQKPEIKNPDPEVKDNTSKVITSNKEKTNEKADNKTAENKDSSGTEKVDKSENASEADELIKEAEDILESKKEGKKSSSKKGFFKTIFSKIAEFFKNLFKKIFGI